MIKKDPRVDAYIASSPDFARPILTHIRKTVHDTCPEVEETIKWGMPHFMDHGILCSMAAFKEHCALILWKAKLMEDKKGMLSSGGTSSLGHFGKLKSLADLPSDRTLAGFLRQGMKLNRDEVPKPAPPRNPAKRALVLPEDLSSALQKDKQAATCFEAFSPSKKKECLEWITEAKTEATRQRRVTQAVAWIHEGKSRNWKYERPKS